MCVCKVSKIFKCVSALVSLKMSDALKGGAKTGNTIHYTEMHTQCPLCILSFCAKFFFQDFCSMY